LTGFPGLLGFIFYFSQIHFEFEKLQSAFGAMKQFLFSNLTHFISLNTQPKTVTERQ